jgi:hypothetical protein
MTDNAVGSTPAGGIADPTAGAAPAGAGTPSTGELNPQGGITFDQDFTDWLGTKGVKTTDAFKNEDVYKIAKSYRETEKWALGGEKIVVPKEGAPTEIWDALFNKIGRPPTAEGYKLEVGDKADEGLTKSFKEQAHKAGITQNGVEGLYKWFSETATQLESQQEADKTKAFDAEKITLGQEWGKDSVRNADLADRGTNVALRLLGLEGEKAVGFQEKLEAGIGLRNAAVLMMKLSELAGTTGDTFEGDGAKGAGFTPSAKQAEAEIAKLKADRTFQEQRRNGNSDAVTKWNNLHRIAAGNGNFEPRL